MNRTAAIALMNMILALIADSTVLPAIDTPDLVDGHGFRVSPIRRFQQIAVDRFDATDEQAQLAAIAWVRAGRPTRPVR